MIAGIQITSQENSQIQFQVFITPNGFNVPEMSNSQILLIKITLSQS